ncbi:MAG: hypothetical protein SVM86_01025 [Candidatus Cloacimonadota bacterium]|nr:hypothetical protein [Candidatus Cloacimonadota bacterium]
MARRSILIIAVLIFFVACNQQQVSLERFPYPYQAAFTICSDIDNTCTLEELTVIQEFLCTDKKTAIGNGLNLPLGNSFWMENELIKFGVEEKFSQKTPDYGISYLSAWQDSLPVVQKTIREYNAKGWIDCLHSYGHFSQTGFNRQRAKEYLQIMRRDSLQVDVFVNHGGLENLHSLGFSAHQLGDNPETDFYHADLTIDYGIRYLWDGQLSHAIGLSGSFSLENSLKNAFETLQDWFNPNFCYKHNLELAYPITLEDGSKIFRFTRFLNSWGKHDRADINFMAEQINDDVLQKLLKNRGYLIYYTHLGENDGLPYFKKQTIAQLRKLKKMYEQGKLWITSTSELLNYYTLNKYLN